jgi:hypothetical protein
MLAAAQITSSALIRPDLSFNAVRRNSNNAWPQRSWVSDRGVDFSRQNIELSIASVAALIPHVER